MERTVSKTTNRLLFFDMVRNLAMLSVVLYHAAGAYSTVASYWPVHDGSSIIADGIRELFDVFMMPIFFFLAGYFTFPSLNRQGTLKFLTGEIKTPWSSLVAGSLCHHPNVVILHPGKGEPRLLAPTFLAILDDISCRFRHLPDQSPERGQDEPDAFLVPLPAPQFFYHVRLFPRREKHNA